MPRNENVGSGKRGENGRVNPPEKLPQLRNISRKLIPGINLRVADKTQLFRIASLHGKTDARVHGQVCFVTNFVCNVAATPEPMPVINVAVWRHFWGGSSARILGSFNSKRGYKWIVKFQIFAFSYFILPN